MGIMGRKTLGIGFIIVGVLYVLGTLGVFHFAWDTLWPLFLAIPAIGFHVMFFSNPSPERAGVLVPGGVLATLTVLFLWNTTFGWDQMTYLWPVFILAPAVGLFELFLFGTRQPALLIPVLVLTTVALVFFGVNIMTTAFGSVVAVVLVLAGLYLIFSGKKKSNRF